MTASAAFFDLDRTLISGSSAVDFGLAAWRNKLLPAHRLVTDLFSAIAFKLFGASDEKSQATKERVLEAVKGASQADLVALNEDIIPSVLGKVRPEAKSLLEMHEEAGRDTFIVSASPYELVSPLAHALGMTGGIGTRPEVVDGRYTGGLDGPFCYGEGKAEIIGKIAAERGYDLRLSYSYSDSVSDLPMLEMVGHPVAVNPDRGLETVARQRGWPIVIFARRTKQAIKLTTAVSLGVAAAGSSYALGRRHGRIQADAVQGRASRLLGR